MTSLTYLCAHILSHPSYEVIIVKSIKVKKNVKALLG